MYKMYIDCYMTACIIGFTFKTEKLKTRAKEVSKTMIIKMKVWELLIINDKRETNISRLANLFSA
jgi:hypothetical protein